MALRKGNEDLLKAVNDAIAEMQKMALCKPFPKNGLRADVTK